MKAFHSPDAPKAIGPYSQAIGADNFVFISGQIPVDPATGELEAGGVDKQAERCLRNIAAILAEAGMDFSNVVKSTVYLRDMADFAAMNQVYSGFFKEPYPARAAFAVAGLPKDARIEIEVIACKSK